MRLVIFMSTALVCVFGATSALAQISNTSATSRATIPTPLQDIRLSYFGDLSVPASKANGSEWFHEPGLSYRLQRVSLKFKVGFTQYAARTERRDNLFEIGDPSFGMGVSDLVKTKGFNLYGGFNLSPAMSDYSKMKQRAGSLGVTLIPSSTFGAGSFKLDWLTSLKTYFYEADDNLSAANKRDLNRGRMSQYKIEFYPALAYRISDGLEALLGGNLAFYQNRGRDLSEWARTKNALHAGFSYRVARSLSVRPELRLPDPGKWNIDTVEAGMLFFGSL